jgi:hypothetical protein
MINADQYDSAPASISTTVSGGAIGGIVCGALNSVGQQMAKSLR